VTATRLAERLGKIHDSPAEVLDPPGVQPHDLTRFGDIAQSLVQTALVENGFPLRKASALAESVRQQADAIVAAEAATS
jgi:hypothetical protein